MFWCQDCRNPYVFKFPIGTPDFLVPLVPPGTWFSEKVKRSPGIVIEIWLGFHRLFILSLFISSRSLSSPIRRHGKLVNFLFQDPQGFADCQKYVARENPDLFLLNFRKMYVATPGKTSYLSSAVSKLFFLLSDHSRGSFPASELQKDAFCRRDWDILTWPCSYACTGDPDAVILSKTIIQWCTKECMTKTIEKHAV